MSDKKNILVCVSGLTPQIITESLFCLSVLRKIPIHEIYVLTTKRGREVITGRDRGSSAKTAVLKDEVSNLCGKYKLPLPLFDDNEHHIITAREESVELSDVRSDKHNTLFPNKVAEFLRQKSGENNTRMFCVISGGRKSMSVHLAFALSVFGREDDKLLHVLTSEQNEFKGYYPLKRSEFKDLELSEIPYVRLRSLLGPEINSKNILNKKFSDIVLFAQKQLKIMTGGSSLLVDVENRRLAFGPESIQLEPLEFALYFAFVESALDNSKKTYPIQEINSAEFGMKIRRFIEENYSYYYFNDQLRSQWWVKGFTPESFRTKRSKINDKLSKLFNDPDIYQIYFIDSLKKYFETSYRINAGKSRFKIIY